MESVYLNVALIKRLPRSLGLLTYTNATDAKSEALVGRWVRVPFRGRMVDGIVWSIARHPPEGVTLQPISAVHDFPLWNKERRDFVERFARVHWISLPHALDVMVPERPQRDTVRRETRTPSAGQRDIVHIHRQREEEIAAAVGACMQSGSAGLKFYFPLGSRAERIVAMLHICQALPAQQQACILVPTHDAMRRCASALVGTLGSRLLLLDAALPKRAYWNAWINTARHPGAVVMTTKRGLFAPFHSLGAVIVDQGTDRNHRQSDMNPRYDAREIAEWITDQHHAMYFTFDAVPTLRTLHDGGIEKKVFSKLPGRRFIIDRLLEPRRGYDDILAPEVIEAVKKTRDAALFFVNRRGTAKSLFCRECGWMATCSSCGLACAVADDALRCSRCATEQSLPLQCGRCQSDRLKMRGMGVQQCAKKLKKVFPERPITVLEGSGTSGVLQPGALIVATEKIFSLSFLPRIQTIVFPDVDALLRHPGYATYEFVLCLCERVCSLGERSAEVYVQTRDCGHPFNRALREQRPDLLYTEERQTREILRLPPAVDIFKLTCKGKDRASLEQQTKLLVSALHGDPAFERAMTLEEMGIVEARHGKKNVRTTLLLRSLSDTPASATLERVRAHLSDAWIVERNPESLTE